MCSGIIICNTRNPVPKARPLFSMIQLELQLPDFTFLTWTVKDVAASTEQARTLGVPLEAGEKLYMDSQHLYTC